MYIGTTKTLIAVAIFAMGYLFFVIRKTARQDLDIYDLAMLSTVAIIPLLFIVLPQLAFLAASLVGVEFPFVIMFGMLLAILFIFVHRLTVKIHRLEADNRLLVQELSLLKEAVGDGGGLEGSVTSTDSIN
jgi:hypothetical protein